MRTALSSRLENRASTKLVTGKGSGVLYHPGTISRIEAAERQAEVAEAAKKNLEDKMNEMLERVDALERRAHM